VKASTSVVTLARGRAAHLANQVVGLARQTVLPGEMIVAVMQDQIYDLPPTPFPIRQIRVAGAELPLAAARNAAAKAATGERLVFLDVDCIPAPGLIEDYAAHLADLDGLLMGEVLYLPAGATAPPWSDDHFARVAQKHSDRRGPPSHGIELCEDYRCFWSLNFAIRTATFRRMGGFDERYRGYGGEDTDYAKGLTLQQVPLAWVTGARAYHQHHPHHMPPIHHLQSVVRNAELFEAKWGYRTMGHWLHAFRLMRLIDDTPGRPISILREPDGEDHRLTVQTDDMPYVNTARVIQELESRLRSQAFA
jgi:GT2 family glycosyltransferase